MTARLSIILTAAIAIVAVATGCGGDDGENGPASVAGEASGGDATIATSSLDKPEYLKRAHATCIRGDRNILTEMSDYEADNPPDGRPSGEQFADLIRAVVLTRIKGEIEAVRALGAPEGDEEEVEAILIAQEEDVEETAKQESIAGFREAEKFMLPSAGLARAYGLTKCTHIAALEG